MNYYSFTRDEIVGFLYNENLEKVLEVGSAQGNFGKNLNIKFGSEVWGIEPNKEAHEIAENNLFKSINSFYTSSVDLPANYFDAIFFNDVLEHMLNPSEALILSKKFLNARGHVYASIPNFLYFNNIYSLIKTGDWKYSEAGILDKSHLRFFTRISMIRLFEESGYEVLELHGINPTDNPKFLKFYKIFPRKLERFLYTQYFIKAKPVL